MNFDVLFINDSNKSLLRKPCNSNAIYYSEIKEQFAIYDALRSFSIKMVLEGSLYYEINDQRFEVGPGNFFLASYRDGVKAYNKVPVKTICIDIKPELIAEVYTILNEKYDHKFDDYLPDLFEYPSFHDSIYSLNENNLGRILQLIATGITKNDPGHSIINSEYLFELLEQIILVEKGNRLALNGLKTIKDSTRKETLTRLMKGRNYIDNNFLKNPQIPEIATHSNMSEFHFYRCFKQAFGITPYRYILKKRLLHSQDLLQRKLPVNKIAFLCGFPDSSTYTKAFSRSYGTPPSKYFARDLSINKVNKTDALAIID